MNGDMFSPSGNDGMRPFWMTPLQKTTLNLGIMSKLETLESEQEMLQGEEHT